MTRTARKLGYKEGYQAGQYDAQANGWASAYQYDEGMFQSAEWKQGYYDGKLDARTR